MKRSFSSAVVLVMIFVLFGCDSGQYQIITGSDGSLYRFNKKTGELSMIMEDKKVVRLSETQKADMVKSVEENPLDKPINWKESRFPAKTKKSMTL